MHGTRQQGGQYVDDVVDWAGMATVEGGDIGTRQMAV